MQIWDQPHCTVTAVTIIISKIELSLCGPYSPESPFPFESTFGPPPFEDLQEFVWVIRYLGYRLSQDSHCPGGHRLGITQFASSLLLSLSLSDSCPSLSALRTQRYTLKSTQKTLLTTLPRYLVAILCLWLSCVKSMKTRYTLKNVYFPFLFIYLGKYNLDLIFSLWLYHLIRSCFLFFCPPGRVLRNQPGFLR